jgi:hypothetical protein
MTRHGAIRRRTLLQAALGLGLVGSPAMRAAATEATDDGSVAQDAFIWGVPPVLASRYRGLAAGQGAPVNRFLVTPTLATPALKTAGPNVDTLYGFGWLDLGPEPVVLRVPDTHDRYYSIQLIDAYQNVFDYVGRRQTGTQAGVYALTPPGWSGVLPAGIVQIRAPTSLVLALTRTLVSGAKDLPAAQAIQAQYALGPLSAWPNRLQAPLVQENALNAFPIIDLAAEGPPYFDELGALLQRYPPPANDAVALPAFAPIGVGPGLTPSRDPRLAKALAGAAPAAVARLKAARYSAEANGWSVNYNITNFVADPLARAATARIGPGAHIAREALYFGAANGPDGRPLNGQMAYVLTFAPGQLPPVDAFWSLTLYGEDHFLVDNPIGRYAINDRTEGLAHGPDGSLTLAIQHGAPAAGTSNWLPAPQGGFSLVMRTYQPRPEVYKGVYHLPPLRIV